MKNKNNRKELFCPSLLIESPVGLKTVHKIEREKVIIGRLKSENDLPLEPDPQKLITRYMHCSIEYEINSYWLIDNASKNGTFILRHNQTRRICGKEKLLNGDIILVLGSIKSDSTPEYWRLTFSDPNATEDIGNLFQQNYLDYDWIEAKLYLCTNNQKKEIPGLSPQEHKLIRFMQQKNFNNRNTAVMCSYTEIIDAVWDELKSTRSKNDVNHLIAGLRKKIEPDPDEPKFLINIRGMGYRLITKSVI